MINTTITAPVSAINSTARRTQSERERDRDTAVRREEVENRDREQETEKQREREKGEAYWRAAHQWPGRVGQRDCNRECRQTAAPGTFPFARTDAADRRLFECTGCTREGP